LGFEVLTPQNGLCNPAVANCWGKTSISPTTEWALIGIAFVTTTNCGHVCDCHLTAPIDRVNKLAAATIPIMTFALIGRVFVMAVSGEVSAPCLFVSKVAHGERRR